MQIHVDKATAVDSTDLEDSAHHVGATGRVRDDGENDGEGVPETVSLVLKPTTVSSNGKFTVTERQVETIRCVLRNETCMQKAVLDLMALTSNLSGFWTNKMLHSCSTQRKHKVDYLELEKNLQFQNPMCRFMEELFLREVFGNFQPCMSGRFCKVYDLEGATADMHPLLREMSVSEAKAYCLRGELPKTPGRCVLCRRHAMTTHYVENLILRKSFCESIVTQTVFNLVDVPGEYCKDHCILPDPEINSGLIMPMVMYMKMRLKIVWNRDGSYSIDQSRYPKPPNPAYLPPVDPEQNARQLEEALGGKLNLIERMREMRIMDPNQTLVENLPSGEIIDQNSKEFYQKNLLHGNQGVRVVNSVFGGQSKSENARLDDPNLARASGAVTPMTHSDVQEDQKRVREEHRSAESSGSKSWRPFGDR